VFHEVLRPDQHQAQDGTDDGESACADAVRMPDYV